MKLRRSPAALLLVAAWAVFFSPELFSAAVPYYRDNLLTYLPLKAFVGGELRAGRWPAWYPYESLGMPFIGQVVTAFFHPHTLLSLLLPPADALKLELLLAYLFGAAGAYRMARAARCSRLAALVGAFSLAFGGYALGMSNNLPYLLGLATLPWVAWGALRIAGDPAPRRIVPLALAVALVFLGGDAQSAMLCPLVVAAALAGSPRKARSLALCAAAAVLAALLVACELLPALALTPETVRGMGVPSATMGRSFALHPRRLPELLLPHFVPDEVRFRVVGELLGGGTALWSSSIFAGVIALLLAALAVAWRRRAALPWLAVAALCAWLALGDYGGLLRPSWAVLPMLSRFRYPEKYLAVVCVALALLAALGFDAAAARPRAASRAAAAWAAVLGALALAVAFADVPGLAWRSAGRILQPGDPAHAVVREAWLSGAAREAAIAALAALVLTFARRRPAAAALLPVLAAGELWLGNGDQFPLVAREALELPTPFAAQVLRDSAGPYPRVVPVAKPQVFSTVTLGDGERWVATTRMLLRPDAAALSGIAAFGVNLPGTSARDFLLLGPRDERAAMLHGRLGACHRIEDLGARLRPGDVPELVNPEVRLALVRQPCVPYARLAAAIPARDADEARARVVAGLPEEEIVWEGGPSLPRAGGKVEVASWRPGAVELSTDAEAPAALVVTEAFVRGWTAAVDGRPAPLHPADSILLGVEVPAGRHRVVLSYATPRGAAGLVLSAAGLLACAAIGAVARRGVAAGAATSRSSPGPAGTASGSGSA